MSSKKDIQKLKKSLDQIQSKLPPEKAAKLNLRLLEKAERDRKQQEQERRRKEERERFRETVADVTLGIASAITSQRQIQNQEQPLVPSQAYFPPANEPSASVEETLRQLQQNLDADIEAENNRIINQSLKDVRVYQSKTKTQDQELAGAFVVFLISLICFSFFAAPLLGVNISTIQNLFNRETNK